MQLEFDSNFQVILTDIMMPEMDGIEFLMNVRENEATKEIPIIGFTAGDINYYREKSAGQFSCLVPKPIDFFDLYQLAKSQVA